MGRRSATETVAAVYMAFFEQNVWRQAELADHVGVKVEALRKVLKEVQAAGMPIESEREDQQVRKAKGSRGSACA